MEYPNIKEARFLHRPNRFLAQISIEGTERLAHVKNTGRFKELLIPGTRVFVEDHGQASWRKTRYSLITVEKGDRLVNLDSQRANQLVHEALFRGQIRLPGFEEPIKRIRPETAYGASRFDFFLEGTTTKAFLEVKTVTLEEEGVARFPDAPTERGIKHLEELSKAILDGYLAYVIFVIQLPGVHSFQPNDKTHKAFGETLRKVTALGVVPLAFSCEVTPATIELANPVPIDLSEEIRE